MAMSTLYEEGSPTIHSLFGNGKEEVFRIHVLVNEMEPALLWCQAFPLTALNEA
jgi:hypothetical protein